VPRGAREKVENRRSKNQVYREKQCSVKMSLPGTAHAHGPNRRGLAKFPVFGMLSASFQIIFREDGDIVHGDPIGFGYIHEILC